MTLTRFLTCQTVPVQRSFYFLPPSPHPFSRMRLSEMSFKTKGDPLKGDEIV